MASSKGGNRRRFSSALGRSLSTSRKTTSEQARALSFAALATRLRRSQAAKAAWARRKAIVSEEIAARAKVEAFRKEQARTRAAAVRAAKQVLAGELSRARAAQSKPKKKPKTLSESAAQQSFQLDQDRGIVEALREVEIEAAGGTSEERARAALKIRNEVVLGREAMEARLSHFYSLQVAAGKVREIKPGRKPGILYRRSGPMQEGFIRQKKIGRLLSQMSREDIAEAASEIAEKLRKRQPTGKLYASISFFEYGRGKPSYYTIGEDELGVYVQSFDSLGNPKRSGEIDSVDEFESRLRELLLVHSTEHNAVLLDTIEIKTFREKTQEERKAFGRMRHLKRQARAAAKKAKPK